MAFCVRRRVVANTEMSSRRFLMSFEGSCFVIDPKGQAAATTARFRKEVLGQDVCVLNPFGILPEYLRGIRHARYDPVTSQLDPASPNTAADADNLMEGLMPHGGKEVHWIDSARQLGSGITIDLRETHNRWSLPDVYKIISSRELYAFCENALDIGASEYVEMRLSRFSGKQAAGDREKHSVVSTAITRLSFIGNKPIADNLRDSTVDFREMKSAP